MLPSFTFILIIKNTPLALILSCAPLAVNTISLRLVSSFFSSVEEISLMTFLAIALIASSHACSSSFLFAA